MNERSGKKGRERMASCGECSMLLPAERPVFHPHIYCMLYKAGVRDLEGYMEATFPLLRDRFMAKVPTLAISVTDEHIEGVPFNIYRREGDPFCGDESICAKHEPVYRMVHFGRTES